MSPPRWLRWLLRRQPSVDLPPPPPRQCPSNGAAAAEARRRAEAALRHTISQQPRVEEVARQARRLRPERLDAFGAEIQEAMRRRAA